VGEISPIRDDSIISLPAILAFCPSWLIIYQKLFGYVCKMPDWHILTPGQNIGIGGIGVRFKTEWLSALTRKTCPFYPGMGVRFDPDFEERKYHAIKSVKQA